MSDFSDSLRVGCYSTPSNTPSSAENVSALAISLSLILADSHHNKYHHSTTPDHQWCYRSGVALISINEVNLRRARLVLG